MPRFLARAMAVFGGASASIRKSTCNEIALLLQNGVVYISWASFGDNGPYHGWVMGYNVRTLRQVSALNVTANGEAGGIWMGGGGLASDATGSIFAATGNGTFDADKGGKNFGDSVVKLSPTAGLKVADYFTPFNQAALQAKDQDLGSGGVLLLPDQPGPFRHLLVASSKDGTLYLINRDRMGRFSKKGDQVVQEIFNATPTTYGPASYFNGTVYVVANPRLQTDAVVNGAKPQPVLTAYKIINGHLFPVPTRGNFGYGYPGSTPSISANGSSNGIVWTIDNGGAFISANAVLRAYNANDITQELWDSNQVPARDAAGPGVKFTVPTIANGKVFVGGNGVLTIYGLLPPSSL